MLAVTDELSGRSRHVREVGLPTRTVGSTSCYACWASCRVSSSWGTGSEIGQAAAAVDDQELACHVGCLCAGEELKDVCNVFWRANATRWDFCRHGFDGIGPQ